MTTTTPQGTNARRAAGRHPHRRRRRRAPPPSSRPATAHLSCCSTVASSAAAPCGPRCSPGSRGTIGSSRPTSPASASPLRSPVSMSTPSAAGSPALPSRPASSVPPSSPTHSSAASPPGSPPAAAPLIGRLVVYAAPGVGPYRMPLRLRYVAIRFAIRPTAAQRRTLRSLRPARPRRHPPTRSGLVRRLRRPTPDARARDPARQEDDASAHRHPDQAHPRRRARPHRRSHHPAVGPPRPHGPARRSAKPPHHATAGRCTSSTTPPTPPTSSNPTHSSTHSPPSWTLPEPTSDRLTGPLDVANAAHTTVRESTSTGSPQGRLWSSGPLRVTRTRSTSSGPELFAGTRLRPPTEAEGRPPGEFERLDRGVLALQRLVSGDDSPAWVSGSPRSDVVNTRQGLAAKFGHPSKPALGNVSKTCGSGPHHRVVALRCFDPGRVEGATVGPCSDVGLSAVRARRQRSPNLHPGPASGTVGECVGRTQPVALAIVVAGCFHVTGQAPR